MIPIAPTEDIDTAAALTTDFLDKALMRSQIRAIVERKLDELP